MADAIATATGTGDVQIFTGEGKLWGYACRESGTVAAVAAFIIRDGTSTSGKVLIPVELQADRSASEGFGSPIEFRDGLFLDRIAGETEVVVFVE